MDSEVLSNLLKIAPMAIILIVAIIFVLRGLRRDGDSTNNRAKGGGVSNSEHWGGS